ncbi:hypothetical protein LCGC14_0501270 [marine sediment metagenome]|uniref:BREX-3 system P-loop-containing protein BrxF n=1 Tax=marine sediment metagenome TaxID=412755 RepID=A0A0F9UQM4_9ZZZZ|nr:BREX-3 system P-loop-containing protein BrxF [Methylophaga sp.]HEC60566.1 BREX-3 system P-loop-containing protein BrxF [Methylophaga sp.]
MSVLISQPKNIKKELIKSLESGSLRASNLILLAVKETEYQLLATQDNSNNIINLSKDIAGKLLGMSNKERKDNVPKLLASLVEECEGICWLNRIALLFEESLEIDPLKLLKKAARKKPLVVFWSGDIDAFSLSYSKPGRPDYKSYNLSELQDVQVITTYIQGVNE